MVSNTGVTRDLVHVAAFFFSVLFCVFFVCVCLFCCFPVFKGAPKNGWCPLGFHLKTDQEGYPQKKTYGPDGGGKGL